MKQKNTTLKENTSWGTTWNHVSTTFCSQAPPLRDDFFGPATSPAVWSILFEGCPQNVYKWVNLLPIQTMHYYRQITQNYHTFVLLGSPNVGSLMTPVFSAKLPFFSPSPTTQGFLRPSDIFLWLASHMQWQRPVPFNDGAWGGLNYVFAGNVPCCEYRDCTIKPCWIFESQWQDGTINHGVIYEIFTRYLQVYSMYTYINVSWTMPKHCNSVSEGLLEFPSQTINRWSTHC